MQDFFFFGKNTSLAEAQLIVDSFSEESPAAENPEHRPKAPRNYKEWRASSKRGFNFWRTAREEDLNELGFCKESQNNLSSKTGVLFKNTASVESFF